MTFIGTNGTEAINFRYTQQENNEKKKFTMKSITFLDKVQLVSFLLYSEKGLSIEKNVIYTLSTIVCELYTRINCELSGFWE